MEWLRSLPAGTRRVLALLVAGWTAIRPPRTAAAPHAPSKVTCVEHAAGCAVAAPASSLTW